MVFKCIPYKSLRILLIVRYSKNINTDVDTKNPERLIKKIIILSKIVTIVLNYFNNMMLILDLYAI